MLTHPSKLVNLIFCKFRKTWADVFEEPEDFSAFSEQLPPERSEALPVQNAEEEG